MKCPPEILAVIDRDHEQDIERLNQSLKLKGEARFVSHVPPHTFVGNLNEMEPGNCILLMGINPKYNQDKNFQRVNIDLPTRCLAAYRRSGQSTALEDWCDFQMNYFLREERNKRHFSKFGKWLGPNWFPKTYFGSNEDSRIDKTLHNHVVEVDAVQYFSHKTSINSDLLATIAKSDPALKANAELLSWIARKIRPRWIQVNGKSNWDLIMRLFADGEFTCLNHGTGLGTEIKVGYVILGGIRLPVLMHKFFGSMRGVNSLAERDMVRDAWNEWFDSAQTSHPSRPDNGS